MNVTTHFLFPIPIPISVSTVTVQAQDSGWGWLVQPIAVFFAVFVAGYINYWLQKRNFNVQADFDLLIRRMDAYAELLADISEYQTEDKMNDTMLSHMAKVAFYGREDIRNIIIPMVRTSRELNSGSTPLRLSVIRNLMITEMADTHGISRQHRPFWL